MSQDVVLDTDLQSFKNLAWWLYVGHALSMLFSLGALSFIPLIINYVHRQETANTFVHSHHSWQIRSFWWYVVWVVVGGALAATIILFPLAMLVWAGAWLWKAYRLVKGISDLNQNRTMPA